MFVLALSLYNTWNRGVFLLCKITNLLIYSKIFDKTIFRKKNEKPQHINDVRLGVSPHIKKCTEYAGREYEFGKCKVYIEEI